MKSRFFFYPHYILEISKGLFMKTPLCNTPAKLEAILCDQHALVLTVHAGFIQHTPDKSFLLNNFVDFPDVAVVFRKSNICYFLNIFYMVGSIVRKQYCLHSIADH